ncbi:MAG: carbohydrate ABC transporter permease [Actinocatenispora sp.]
MTARSRPATRPLAYLALLAYMLFLAFPLAWLVSTALKTPREMASLHPTWIPHHPTLGNFAAAFGEQNLVASAGNSLLVALSASVLTVLAALPAAYALARSASVLNKLALGWVLVSQVFPFILIIIPLFMILKNLELVNSRGGLILVYLTFNLPFALWMLQGYVRGVPRELEEAASVDGAGRLRILRSVVAPLLVPGVVATFLFAFISSWNEFMFALVLLKDPDLSTVPLTLVRFTGADGVARLGPLAAAALLATIPSLALFALIQRRLTAGLLAGAVKG